ncbi:type VI secretion system-associated FHA domain protein TagH [Paraburkholderia sp. NMBU_R16]|uniref:type VI secretion system-associated FHA domain protein TagH n=1 Tax=Paraburkholderia sp. NMBU_R16 TaxID=2698676 RepID=UPI0015658094|nr:type VI secretion system-associated FHA domain protein TagH [Paraburkholderia sp. NMBU_R16]NRO99432.1 type VI secretion system-associated FHA domain protein TagH [Paraburkholderia sp. NMBU_R16]
MQLIVIEHAGHPVAQDRETAVVFRPPGGTIGRDHDNHLVLRDDTRQISRLQALLQVSDEACSLKNLSSVSTIEVNDAPVAHAQARTLQVGDTVRIGPYLLRAEGDENVALETAEGSGPGSAPGSVSRPRAAISQPHEFQQLSTDPLELFGSVGKSGSEKVATIAPEGVDSLLAPPSARPASTVTQADHRPDWASHARLQKVDAESTASLDSPADALPAVPAAHREQQNSTGGGHTEEERSSPDALLRAFFEGAGLDAAAQPRELSSEQMYVAGQLLALFANGTVELLSSRSILKREVKADMTMLLDRENNPLKLLPDGSAVLRQMFGLPFPGFMSPQTAVSDAFQDLHAHQIGMVAGMRAALMDLVARFSPQRLRERNRPQRWYERYVPLLYRARMWSRYENHHRDAVFAIEDDFASVFGKAFLAAYDAEVEGYRGRSRT